MLALARVEEPAAVEVAAQAEALASDCVYLDGMEDKLLRRSLACHFHLDFLALYGGAAADHQELARLSCLAAFSHLFRIFRTYFFLHFCWHWHCLCLSFLIS